MPPAPRTAEAPADWCRSRSARSVAWARAVARLAAPAAPVSGRPLWRARARHARRPRSVRLFRRCGTAPSPPRTWSLLQQVDPACTRPSRRVRRQVPLRMPLMRASTLRRRRRRFSPGPFATGPLRRLYPGTARTLRPSTVSHRRSLDRRPALLPLLARPPRIARTPSDCGRSPGSWSRSTRPAAPGRAAAAPRYGWD